MILIDLTLPFGLKHTQHWGETASLFMFGKDLWVFIPKNRSTDLIRYELLVQCYIIFIEISISFDLRQDALRSVDKLLVDLGHRHI